MSKDARRAARDLWHRGYMAAINGEPAGDDPSEKRGHAVGRRIVHLTDSEGQIRDPHAAFAVLLGGAHVDG